MKVMIACGGTGGHLFPGLAVAEELVARRHEVRLLVSEKAVDQTALAALTDGSRIAVQAVSAIGYTGSAKLIEFCCRLAQATRDCAAACAEFAPDAVLGMGGFTSAPAVMAARWSRRRGTRALIHESNAVPGKANRYAGKLADHVAVGVAECAKFFSHQPVTVTGTPIRKVLRRGKVADAHDRLGLKREKLTVLVTGGSQGALGVNEALRCALPWLEEWTDRMQFVHLSGPRGEEMMREAYEKNGFEAKVMGFCSQMELAYSAADVVISRSGAATLSELAAFGLPAILLPFPYAAGDHQLHNARGFERCGAARLLEHKQLTGLHALAGERLANMITELLRDDAQRQRMADAARSLAVADATERIADLVEQYAN